MRFLFLDIFENVLIYFLYYGYFENQYFVFVMDGLVHMELIVQNIFREILSFERVFLLLEMFYMSLRETLQLLLVSVL